MGRRLVAAVTPEGIAAWTPHGTRGRSGHYLGLSVLLVFLENPEMQTQQ